MGVYIKGMEMPESCPCELLGIGYDLSCSFVGGIPARVKEYYECCQNGTRPSWCPLVPVPPHGRLIDADALMKEFEKAQRTMEQHGQEYSCSFLSSSREISTEWYCVEDMLENAPTVIEAEEGE